jgi:hypothetical protein
MSITPAVWPYITDAIDTEWLNKRRTLFWLRPSMASKLKPKERAEVLACQAWRTPHTPTKLGVTDDCEASQDRYLQWETEVVRTEHPPEKPSLYKPHVNLKLDHIFLSKKEAFNCDTWHSSRKERTSENVDVISNYITQQLSECLWQQFWLSCKELSLVYLTPRRFITVFTRARHWRPFWARFIQSTLSHSASLIPLLILQPLV